MFQGEPDLIENSILADITLLYRCYVVWGGNLRIMVPSSLLLVGSVVCGYMLEGSASVLFNYSWVYIFLAFILNVLLTMLIGKFS